MDPTVLALVRDGLGGAVPFARHAGVVLDEVGDGAASASLPAADAVLNHVGTVHAGALFTLAETASGAAMAGAFAPMLGEIRPMVSEATIGYRRPATAPLRASAALEQRGPALRRLLASDGRVDVGAEVVIADASGREVARFHATWVVTRRRTGTPVP